MGGGWAGRAGRSWRGRGRPRLAETHSRAGCTGRRSDASLSHRVWCFCAARGLRARRRRAGASAEGAARVSGSVSRKGKRGGTEPRATTNQLIHHTAEPTRRGAASQCDAVRPDRPRSVRGWVPAQRAAVPAPEALSSSRAAARSGAAGDDVLGHLRDGGVALDACGLVSRGGSEALFRCGLCTRAAHCSHYWGLTRACRWLGFKAAPAGGGATRERRARPAGPRGHSPRWERLS
jgi:hypothetical protein